MRALVGLMALALSGCSTALPTESSGRAIIEGTADDGDPAVVAVYIQSAGQPGGGLCSGEIVSPHVVLTAAHCVSPNSVGPGAKFFVYTGPSFLFTLMPPTPVPDGALPASEAHASPMWNPYGATSATDDDPYDIGVVILASPTGIPPLSYNHFPLSNKLVDTPARIVGYGLTDGTAANASAGTKYTAPNLVEYVRPQGLELWDDAHATCEGDSGGPTLLMLDGKERIAAVTAFGYRGCPVNYAATGTRVDTNAAFVDGYVAAFDPPAAPPGGACTSDAECGSVPCLDGICTPPCNPGCPIGLSCTGDDSPRCTKPHGCAIAGPTRDRSALVLVLAMLFVIALRDHSRLKR